MLIAVLGIAVSGVLLAINRATQDSVDPIYGKQAVAIAESLLEEILSLPHTFCDPNDAAAAGALGVTNCTLVEGLGPEAGEGRYNQANPFDNVNDYHGFNTATNALPGIRDLSNTLLPNLQGYAASVNVANATLNGTPALLVTVTVTAPRNTVVNLQGYRTQYAPNATP